MNGAYLMNSIDFYKSYHGHEPRHLQNLTDKFRQHQRNVVWLAGDSSLDNKYWFRETAPACNGYEEVLQPQRSKMDIAYWMNKIISEEDRSKGYVVVNAAVEESTVGSRSCGRLRKQDAIIKDNIQPEDYLIVSVGGNDIALSPNLCTVINMLTLVRCMPTSWVIGSCGVSLPCEECCCGCGFSCLNTACGCPPGIGYFVHLFKSRIETYIKNLTSIHRPKKVLVCMIYYPDEHADGSWADPVLSFLNYDKDPRKLQLVIRKIFELATQQINVPGSEVIAVPLFLALDSRETADYIQRVEPSALGGEKMARLLIEAMGDGGKSHMNSRFALHRQNMDRMI